MSDVDDVTLRRFTVTPVPPLFARIGGAFAVQMHPPVADAGNAVDAPFALPDRLRTAVHARQRSWLAGRLCAGYAIAALTQGDAQVIEPIASAADRAPVWPPDLVGAITHSVHTAAAVVAARDRLTGLGIDIEPVMSDTVAANVAPRVFAESGAVSALTERLPFTRAELVTAVFCAKESIYKCLAPVVGAFFEFDAAALVDADISAATLYFRITRDLHAGVPRDTRMAVEYQLDRGQIYTAVVRPAARD
jgi:enterobactin synthetase component D